VLEAPRERVARLVDDREPLLEVDALALVDDVERAVERVLLESVDGRRDVARGVASRRRSS